MQRISHCSFCCHTYAYLRHFCLLQTYRHKRLLCFPSAPKSIRKHNHTEILYLFFSNMCVFPTPIGFLSACLLYSRLVLNLQKFIRYKLLLPSYSFIAPHTTRASLFPLLFCSSFAPSPLLNITWWRFLPSRVRSCIPHHAIFIFCKPVSTRPLVREAHPAPLVLLFPALENRKCA